tara:strand:+ start:319 stop:618 length:300 start_codon:yes stop_codon:yes gene_type:complete
MKEIKTVVMPDGSATQLLTSKPFNYAVAIYNPYYDGWTVRRWEESRTSAEETRTKWLDKKMKEHGLHPETISPKEESKFMDKHYEHIAILELNYCTNCH